MIETLVSTNPDWVLTIARLVIGIVFFAHGAQKLLGWFGGPGFRTTVSSLTRELKLPAPLAMLVIASEFFGGLGLIVGFLSKLDALAIFLAMVGAIAMVHFRYGLFMNWLGNQKGHGIEYHLLAIALTVVVIVKGGGAFSMDYFLSQHGAAEAQQQTTRR